MRTSLERVASWAHAKRHTFAERDAIAALAGLTGDEFDRARAWALELSMCLDPGHCDHIR